MHSPTLLISAGASREYIDDIRFLSNAATGKMGIALAEIARDRGYQVHLALGPTSEIIPSGIQLHPFVSARDLDAIAQELWPKVDVFVATAAVADYRPEQRKPGKIKKSSGEFKVDFVRNPDILERRGQDKDGRVLVGFALEANPTIEEARRKLQQKNLDLIVLNSTPNLGNSAGRFQLVQSDDSVLYEHVSKQVLAEHILNFVDSCLVARLP